MFSSKNDKIEKVDKILTNEAFEELQVDFTDINLAIESGIILRFTIMAQKTNSQ